MDFLKTGRKSRILLGDSKSSSFQRIVARSIDITITATIFFIGKGFWWPLGWMGALGYTAFQDSLGQGQSIGKKIIGLQVIEDNSGLPCSALHSLMRNAPWVLSLFCLPFPVVGVLSQFVFVPLLGLEVYLLITLDSGVRLGDVMGNTVVIEHFQDEFSARQQTNQFDE